MSMQAIGNGAVAAVRTEPQSERRELCPFDAHRCPVRGLTFHGAGEDTSGNAIVNRGKYVRAAMLPSVAVPAWAAAQVADDLL